LLKYNSKYMLKKLEITGFKSFGKKTALEFTTPVTAVVGPNGSGKSNIVEAIRFVLGEQSMKSLRGKAGADLIFKGSKGVSASSRASVTITFDNSKKTFGFAPGSPINVDFDEISIAREVYADGANRYLINGTEVRLKDVIELLASVHIGASGHHIISQGEADRILNASGKDRRAMIEDALGLKVYQYKIRDSERKLEKTTANIKEIESLRREIAPHLTFLKKQVEKIEKANAMRTELAELSQSYFSKESKYLKDSKKELITERESLERSLVACRNALAEFESRARDAKNTNPRHDEALEELVQGLQKIRREKEELERTIGRFEGMREALVSTRSSRANEEPEVTFSQQEFSSVIMTLDNYCDAILSSENIGNAHEIAHSLKVSITTLHNKLQTKQNIDQEEYSSEHYNDISNKITELTESLAGLVRDIASHEEKINALRALQTQQAVALHNEEREYYEQKRILAELESKLQIIVLREEQVEKLTTLFAEEVKELHQLVGHEAVRYTEQDGGADRHSQEELHKKIERIKIRLEDIGGGNGAEIIKEYQETSERDAFLNKELSDLSESITSLRVLISDLKVKLDADFKDGVEKINKAFQQFFALMFGGGSAFLAVMVEHKRSRKATVGDLDEEVVMDVGEDTDTDEFERGIDINVTLPQKKVKDLAMLSGGERSLTSIALLFAMSQVNPPPFLVLDETDAALDEANSRKYGSMLSTLSETSELIVVTHNRETMSRAHVLYGITMGADGSSKVLSIKFDEATGYAK
jgi:chromosome segregation protein